MNTQINALTTAGYKTLPRLEKTKKVGGIGIGIKTDKNPK